VWLELHEAVPFVGGVQSEFTQQADSEMQSVPHFV